MKLHELVESRKNPKANPKISINQAIAQFKDQPNTYISFTEIDKLGINPKSNHDTPVGIYAYPIAYVYERMGDKWSANALPFAGEQPFANIFQAQGNIVDLSTITEGEVNQYIDKLIKYVGKIAPDAIDAIKQANQEQQPTAGQHLWYVIKATTNASFEAIGSRPIVAWTKLFRAIGIDGCIDQGDGMIHENEPTQAVFFSIKAIDNIQRVYNRYSPSQQSASKDKGVHMQKIQAQLRQATSFEEIEKIVKASGYMSIAAVRDPIVRAQLIARTPYMINFVPKPTPREQLEALKHDFENSLATLIKAKQLDQDVVAQAFSETPSYDNSRLIFNKIRQPFSPALQLALVKKSILDLSEIKQPTREVIQYALANVGERRGWLDDYLTYHGINI